MVWPIEKPALVESRTMAAPDFAKSAVGARNAVVPDEMLWNIPPDFLSTSDVSGVCRVGSLVARDALLVASDASFAELSVR